MIMAATMTGLSVSKMFMAGIIPGLLLGFGMCATCYILSVKRHYPKRDKRASLNGAVLACNERGHLGADHGGPSSCSASWAASSPPTEASIICVVYGLFVAVFIYRKMGPKEMYSCLKGYGFLCFRYHGSGWPLQTCSPSS